MFGYVDNPDTLRYLAVANSSEYAGRYLISLTPNYCFNGGGGYPADRGTINGFPFDSFEETKPITDYPVDGEAEVIINKEWRMQSSQLHSGQHLLSAVFLQNFEATSSSFTILGDYATIEVNKKLTKEYLSAGEAAVNMLIQNGIPIQSKLCQSEEEVPKGLRGYGKLEYPYRVVSIEGVDECGCCGTHVGSTKDLLICKILSTQGVKGGTKLFFAFGRAAYVRLAARFDIVDVLTQKLTTGEGYLEHSVSLLQEAAKQHKKKSQALFKLLLPQFANENETIISGCHLAVIRSIYLEMDELYAVLAHNAKLHQNAAVAQQNGSTVYLLLFSKTGKASAVLLLLKSLGKDVSGGGNEQRVSLSFKGQVSSVAAILEEVFHYTD